MGGILQFIKSGEIVEHDSKFKRFISYVNPHTPYRFTPLTRRLRRKLRVSADSSLIRQKIGIFYIK